MTGGAGPTTRVRFVGGPASGQVFVVPATRDERTGGWIPQTPQTYRWPRNTRPQWGFGELGGAVEEFHYYLRPLQRGGWIYVCDDIKDDDVDLEEFVSRVRASWSGLVLHTFHETFCEADAVQVCSPAAYEDDLGRRLVQRMHEAAETASLMIVEVSGPTWERPPDFRPPRYVLRAWCTNRPTT